MIATLPTRSEFVDLWVYRSVTIEDIARKFEVSNKVVVDWAGRWGLQKRRQRRYSERPIILKHEDDHCLPVYDGPAVGDPTQEQIAELAAYCRARRMMSGIGCRVWIDPQEVSRWDE